MYILLKSFERLSVAVDNSKVAWRLVFALLVIHSGLLMYSAYVHSPTPNEPGHLVAGLSHWKFGRFELYRVNPPLVRMVAALPVMIVGYEMDWLGFYDGPGARPIFNLGETFIAANGERSYFLFFLGRLACIPFSLLGAIICYLWTRDLSCSAGGLFACTLWCFSPNILAHASLLTPDAHASSLGLAACYTFWLWLKKPTWTQAVMTGIVLGLAELAKTTLILFYPLWPLLWIVYRWRERAKMTAKSWCREAAMLTLRMAIGLYVLNLVYCYEGSLTPLGEFRFVSNLFSGGNAEDYQVGNRFKENILAQLPMPFPKNYILGIDVQQRDFEEYRHAFFLRGEWSDQGWWYYYIYAALIKTPIGTLLIGVFSLLAFLCQRTLPVGDHIQLLLPTVAIFSVVSSKTGINEHLRYVLPCFAFMYVWIASTMTSWVLHDCPVSFGRGSSYIKTKIIPPLIPILITWIISSSLSIYPHSLSYFNEAIGGPLSGPKHLAGSSLDWGQDLHYGLHYVKKTCGLDGRILSRNNKDLESYELAGRFVRQWYYDGEDAVVLLKVTSRRPHKNIADPQKQQITSTNRNRRLITYAIDVSTE